MAMMAGVLSLVGGIVSAAGAIEQGNYQAQVANNNAKIAEQNAAYSLQAGREAAALQSREGAAKEAAVVGAMAASNVDTTAPGSARDVRVGEQEVNKLDTLQKYHDVGELPAYGYTIKEKEFEQQAKQAKIGAEYAAVGDVLGGIGSFASDASSFGGFGFGGGSSGTSTAASSGYNPLPVSGDVLPTVTQIPQTAFFTG